MGQQFHSLHSSIPFLMCLPQGNWSHLIIEIYILIHLVDEIMLPYKETSYEDSPIQDLSMALHELMNLQQQSHPQGYMQLDTHFQLLNFFGEMNRDVVNSQIYNLSTYFKTCLEMVEDMRLQIDSLHLEIMVQAWQDTQLENISLVIELREIEETSLAHIKSQDGFYHELISCFYHPRYLQNLLEKWLQLLQILN